MREGWIQGLHDGARIEVLLTAATPPNVNLILGCNALRALSACQARPKCRGAHECTHVPAHRSNTHVWLYCFDILELIFPWRVSTDSRGLLALLVDCFCHRYFVSTLANLHGSK